MDQYFYFKQGDRSQYVQENIRKDHFTVNSRVFYKQGIFSDFKGSLVGLVKFPGNFSRVFVILQTPESTPQLVTGSNMPLVQMPTQPPYPFQIAVQDATTHSGWSYWILKFGEPPTLSNRNQKNPTTKIRLLQDSGIGLDPASNLGIFNKAGGWGWNPIDYEYRFQPLSPFPGFEEQKQENPAQAASHPGYNNLQAYVPSTLVNQRMRGNLGGPSQAKLVAANPAGENGIAYYGNAKGQIPESPRKYPLSPFPENLL